VSTRTQDELPQELQQALNHGLLKRLPITFIPFTRQQLRDWPFLFPYERQSVLRLLLYLASLNEDQFTATFHEVVQLEEKMGVRSWQFSSNEQTILNASLLARSPYYQDWRRAVQKVFDAAEQHAQAQNAENANVRRCILLVLPRTLPVDSTKIWQRWQGIGRAVQIDAMPPGETSSISELLLGSNGAGDNGCLLATMSSKPDTGPAGTWILDAGQSLIDCALKQALTTSYSAILLSHARLATFRAKFSHEMNTMRKDLEDADAVYDRLRKTDVTPWCPAEVASQPVVREFLRSLYLSGNGALLFGNSFVEWGASEAFRRARPSLVVAQFGVRSRPKPFTSVVVFENQDEINPLPAADDLPGSALDAQVLALYVWLAASRYNEYQRNTVCLCLAESISQAYVIAPNEFALVHENGPVTIAELRSSLNHWMTGRIS
jgi:hypothetical protein